MRSRAYSELLLAERDAVRTDAMFSCRPAHERAPAAADVEQAFASLQTQLAADVLQLVALSLVQRVIRRLEIAIRVDPLGIEPESIERVGHISEREIAA